MTKKRREDLACDLVGAVYAAVRETKKFEEGVLEAGCMSLAFAARGKQTEALAASAEVAALRVGKLLEAFVLDVMARKERGARTAILAEVFGKTAKPRRRKV